MQLNVYTVYAQVKLIYMPGKRFWNLKILSGTSKTEAGKTKTETTETKLKFAENYFQEGVKFLLNWKYGIAACEVVFQT